MKKATLDEIISSFENWTLTEWEQKFIEGVKSYFYCNKDLTKKQEIILWKIYHKIKYRRVYVRQEIERLKNPILKERL